jgi:hypothetical protein
MISYKKIDLMKISLNEKNTILQDNEILEIKSPIIEFGVEKVVNVNQSIINLNVNRFSDSHNLFLNLLMYIERIYNVNNITCDLINNDKIKINVNEDSKIFDKNTKIINMNYFDFKNIYKCVISFNVNNGFIYLRQLILVN